jgi:hypothetical protein
LLTPNDKERIKIKDIFTHPWVIEFEKEEKERRVKQYSEKSSFEVNNKLVSNILDDDKDEIKLVKKEVRRLDLDKRNEPKKKSDKYDSNNLFDKDDENSFEIVNKKKKKSKVHDDSLNKSNNDVFDDVLDLVKQKNTSILH